MRSRGSVDVSLGLAAAAFAVAVAGTGCRPDFAPYNRVTGLRVLAIQSEPAAPTTGETATFSALVVTPSTEPAPAIAYHWSWCPFAGNASDGYRCPIEKPVIDGILEKIPLPPLPSYDLGDAPTASFVNDISPDAFKAVCAGGLPGLPSEFKVDCTAGFPIQLMLTVTTDTDTLTAVQTVKLRFDPAMPANLNPTIDGLQAILAGVPTAIPDGATDAAGLPVEPVTLPRDVETPLRVSMAETNAEVYAGFDDNELPATLTERLFLTWFVESGDTNDPRTSFYSGSTAFADLLKNGWTPALVKDYPPATARIYVVAHDNRGGVSWRAGTVDLGAAL